MSRKSEPTQTYHITAESILLGAIGGLVSAGAGIYRGTGAPSGDQSDGAAMPVQFYVRTDASTADTALYASVDTGTTWQPYNNGAIASLSDGTVTITAASGSVTETGLVNLTLTGSGTATISGEGVNTVGSATCTSTTIEAGVGALTVNADAASTMTIGTSLTLATPTLNTSGNVVVNSDATAAANNNPTIALWDGDAVAAPNDDLIKAQLQLDGVNERLELSLTRQRNGGAVVQQGVALHVGRSGEVTASVDASVVLNSATDASAANPATIIMQGQEDNLDFSGAASYTLNGNASVTGTVTVGADVVLSRQAANVGEFGSGDSVFAVNAPIGRRGASADANPTAQLTGSQLDLGAGGATAVDCSILRQAANVMETGASDSLYAVGSTLGVRAATGDANATASLSGSALSLGAGGATAVDITLTRQAANVAELGDGDSLYSVGAASLGRRNASADANPTCAITANGIELGAGGGTATDWTLSRSGVGIAGVADSKSLTFGTSQDTGISHNGTNTIIDHNTGELILAMGTRALTQDPEIGGELKRQCVDSGAVALDNADGTTTITLNIPTGARLIGGAANITTAIADVSAAGVTVALAFITGSTLAMGNFVTGGDGNLAQNTKLTVIFDPNQAGIITTNTTNAELTISGGVDNTPSAGAVRVLVWYETLAALDNA